MSESTTTSAKPNSDSGKGGNTASNNGGNIPKGNANGLNKVGVIEGHKWIDLDGKPGGETKPGAGWEMKLWEDNNNNNKVDYGDKYITSTNTTSDGSYRFSGIKLDGKDNFVVQEVQKSGYKDIGGTEKGADLSHDAPTEKHVDFVNTPIKEVKGVIEGHKWIDLDGKPGGETKPGAGWEMKLWEDNNNNNKVDYGDKYITSTNTTSDGSYRFSGIKLDGKDNFVVQEVQKSGYKDIGGTEKGADLSHDAPTEKHVDFVNTPIKEVKGVIEGHKWIDLDGKPGGETKPGAGWEMKLWEDNNNNNKVDYGDKYITSTNTTSDGSYRFSGIKLDGKDNFVVQEVQKSGYKDIGGTEKGADLSHDAPTEKHVDFVNTPIKEVKGVIEGHKWIDLDGKPGGETKPGAGWEMKLWEDNNNNNKVDYGDKYITSTNTTSDGSYRFSGIKLDGKDNFVVQEVQKSGYKDIGGTEKGADLSHDAPTEKHVDFVNTPIKEVKGVIEGHKWIDLDGKPGGETKPGAGWEMKLWEDNNNNNKVDYGDKYITSTNTTSDGSYRFSGIKLDGKDNFVVQEVQKSGYKDIGGTEKGADLSHDAPTEKHVDFVNTPIKEVKGVIEGHKWIDLDGKPGGETKPGAGWEMKLWEDNNNNNKVDYGDKYITSTNTTSDGSYRFSGIKLDGKDNFVVQEVQKSGYKDIGGTEKGADLSHDAPTEKHVDFVNTPIDEWHILG